METIKIEVEVRETVDIDIDIFDVISGINNLSIRNRWNALAKIINALDMESKDLDDEARIIVIDYLKAKLKSFE